MAKTVGLVFPPSSVQTDGEAERPEEELQQKQNGKSNRKNQQKGG